MKTGNAIMNILLTIAALYMIVLVFLFFYQRSMIYFPDQQRPDPAAFGVPDAQVVEVKTEDGLDLQGWYFPAAEDKPVIVMFHGNAGHFGYRVYKMEPYLKRGYGVLLAEYRGYGGNPGQISEQGLYKDARAFLRWLEEEAGLQTGNIVLYGESLGTGVAVEMAAGRNYAAVVLEAPFSAMVDIAQSKYSFLPVRLLMLDQYRSREKIGRLKAPLLIVHGTQDFIIPLHFARTLFEAANEPKTFVEIPEAGHNDLSEHGAALHVLEFLRNISGPGDGQAPDLPQEKDE